MTDGANLTDGNNVEAGLDRDGINGVDAPVAGVGPRVRLRDQPGPGNPPPGDDPLTPAFQSGEVTDGFYWTNVYHDRLYLLGFTEAARNFQNDNFGRGGIARGPGQRRSSRTARAPTTPTSRRPPTAAAAACRCTSSPARRRTGRAASTTTSSSTS